MNTIDRHFPPGSTPNDLLPQVNADNAPFWNSLQTGVITIQRCTHCARHRFPIAPVCPHCGATQWQWTEIQPHGRIHSWIRYTKSYLPEFTDLMPYVVACVEFPVGIRIFGRLAAPDPHIGAPVQAQIERWPNGRCVIFFSEGE